MVKKSNPAKAAVAWTGAKDSAMAFYKACLDGFGYQLIGDIYPHTFSAF